MTIINESGLYSLILTSRKPSAKRFKKWITSEVLPNARASYGKDCPISLTTPDKESTPVHQETNSVTALTFQGYQVRAVNVDGEVFFVGRDVCERLGYTNPNLAMNDHCKGISKRYPLQTAGGLQQVRIISEPDVMRLIVRSKLPEAESFERWVFEEVLPSIRKTGGYMVAQQDETPEQIMARALLVAQDTIERTKQENIKLSAEVKELSGCAAAYKSAFDTDGLMRLSEACRIIKQDYPEINMHRIPGYLVEAGYLYDSKSKAKPSWRVKVSSADTIKLFQQRVTGVCPYGSVIHIFVTREGFACLLDWAREGLLPVKKGLDF